MALSSIDLYDAAVTYVDRGWCPIPLTLDTNGFPKKPMNAKWTSLGLQESLLLPQWAEARGLGLALGKQSGGLCVLDLDDEKLAEEAFAASPPTRMVRTIRGRGHIYFRSTAATPSRVSHVQYHGRTVCIELKGDGTQVAASPTPGYTLISDTEPMQVSSLSFVFDQLAKALGFKGTHLEGYPFAWAEKVPMEARNKSAYVEAQTLREARMPLPLALRYMRIRWETDYEQGDQDWSEVERTIHSAYHKGYGFGPI